MAEGTAQDWTIIRDQRLHFNRKLPDRIMAHLRLLEGDYGGFAVDRLEHSLQTATRAHRAGMDEEFVVCAVLHDMGDVLCSHSHADLAAAVLLVCLGEPDVRNWH